MLIKHPKSKDFIGNHGCPAQNSNREGQIITIFNGENVAHVKIFYFLYIVVLLCFSGGIQAQDVSLYQQFNGRYDFVFFGNTLNSQENGNLFAPCSITTSSSAGFFLNAGDTIEKAFLYWAGSGTGDFDVTLNGVAMTPERTFTVSQVTPQSTLPFFSAFRDITDFVITTGNGAYNFADLDLNSVIPDYCPNRTNFGGWAIIVVYKNDLLPLNQLNVYDGLQFVSQLQPELNISLSSLNVIDNEDAKIGFLAWEGDKLIAVNETLKINGNPLSNLPLNPENNAFNGTNSFTGSDVLFNMDLDVYNIQNNISIGDTEASIQMTSGQDFVMINAIVTKLNSQLPDATVSIENVQLTCNSRVITVDYNVMNVNSTNELQAGVPISIFADGVFVAFDETTLPIAIGGSLPMQITLILPPEIPDEFTLTFSVDDTGNGTGIVTELIETNNQDSGQFALLDLPGFNDLPPLEACNEGFGSATFDLSAYQDQIAEDPLHQVSFHESEIDATAGINPILNSSSYHTAQTPHTIFARIFDGSCFSVTSFELRSKNCPPIIYNYVSANNDGVNDVFFVEGLRNIFLNFKIEIYNRWGVLLWTGNNNTEDWDGTAIKGMLVNGNQVPDGTYYYVLDLNDPGYSNNFCGFLYLNR